MTNTILSDTTTPTPTNTAVEPAIDRRSNRPSPLLLAAPIVWVGSVLAIASVDGFVAPANQPPWPAVVAAVVPVAVFLAGLRIPSVRQAVLGADARIWLAVQLWRVVGAAFLFGWAAGELDAGFAIPAGVGDIATGVAALWLLSRVMPTGTRDTAATRRWSNRHLVGFTALGVGDFAVAVITGVFLRPDGLETLPWILFPTLAVPFFLIVHIVNWTQLRRRPGSR